MHKEWCGRSCSDCENPCRLDESIPCSPNCECLGENGEHTHPECQLCDALPEYQVPFTYDGLLIVRAGSPEEAKEIASSMPLDEILKKACGTWHIEDPEPVE